MSVNSLHPSSFEVQPHNDHTPPQQRDTEFKAGIPEFFFVLKPGFRFPQALVTVLRSWQLFALSSSLRSAAVAGRLIEVAGNQLCRWSQHRWFLQSNDSTRRPSKLLEIPWRWRICCALGVRPCLTVEHGWTSNGYEREGYRCVSQRKGGITNGISIKEQLYEQGVIIQQPEACIQTISSVPCCFDGQLRMWLACQANLCPAKNRKRCTPAVFTFHLPPRATLPTPLLDLRTNLPTLETNALLYTLLCDPAWSTHTSY